VVAELLSTNANPLSTSLKATAKISDECFAPTVVKERHQFFSFLNTVCEVHNPLAFIGAA
jgi:hypothetical protein